MKAYGRTACGLLHSTRSRIDVNCVGNPRRALRGMMWAASSGIPAVTLLPSESRSRSHLVSTSAKPVQDRLQGLDPRLVAQIRTPCGRSCRSSHSSHTRRPFRNMVRCPSSLTLRTGPCCEAARAARVRAPWTERTSSRVSGAIRRIAPKVSRRPSEVGRPRRRRGWRSIPGRWVRGRTGWRRGRRGGGPAWPAGGEVLGVLGVVGGDLLGHPVDRGDELRRSSGRGRGPRQKSAPVRASLRLSAAWNSQRARSGVGRPPTASLPGGELAGDVEQPPAGVAEAERSSSRRRRP